MSGEKTEVESRLERRAQRERRSRVQAEQLLEDKSRELYLANQALQEWSATLEERVSQRTEELERQTRELQLLVRERERFTANVTHELRTPLQGILGFANLGMTRCQKSKPEKVHKWFRTIHQSGETLLQLVNNLLDIAKLEANMMEIVIQKFTVEELYQDILGEFILRCQEKNVRFELIGDGSFTLEADQFRMGQVYRNLVGNALKFCEESSTILLEVNIEKTITEIRVSNEGPKIPDSEADAIFDPFVESSTTRSSAGGTGLGLAICKHIVEAHGGCIWLDTTCDNTCFVIELPRGLFDAQTQDPNQEDEAAVIIPSTVQLPPAA